ncbi:sensor histidine kinase [Bacillus anthracis]|uniref:sensor histidine kinase n=1 Tax=Bacillus anthracis TaxID=1392 RepID=UPI0001DBF496|nr:HAMP domain-containing sensor histidine kinase [Bacillus cereus]ADK03719.1 sensor histidine kinase [Bacillus cereus biovar anthracis str. CI]
MKWKVTRLYITSLIGLIMFILIVQFFAFSYLVFTYNRGGMDDPESLVLAFQKEIKVENGSISITNKGEKFLQEHGAWYKVLNHNSDEIFQMYKPKNTPNHYTPSDLILRYKYDIRDYTTFIGKLDKNTQVDSYIVAFPSGQVLRKSVYLNFNNLSSFYPYGILMLIGVTVVCILLFAYIVARYMSKPVVMIIEHINKLKQGQYKQVPEEKGIYAEVYTNLNQLSHQLEDISVQRKRLDMMRAEWIINISHDLKTPLSSIKGYSEVIGNREYKITVQEMYQYAEVIQNKSIYIEKMIDDLKLTYQLKNTLLPIHKTTVDIVNLTREIIIEFLNMPHYENRIIEFECLQEEIIIKADQGLIQRAIVNLLNNALIHTDNKTLIQVCIKQTIGYTIVTIEDNGEGINKSDLPHIFDRYFRGTNTDPKSGSGLGMAIVKEIIVAHGGEIAVESIEGNGTKIKFQLPIKN